MGLSRMMSKFSIDLWMSRNSFGRTMLDTDQICCSRGVWGVGVGNRHERQLPIQVIISNDPVVLLQQNGM
jgi:hypothetical protein